MDQLPANSCARSMRVNVLQDGQVEWTGALAEFVAANELANDEAAKITAALERDGAYDGGGGAGVEWRLERVEG